jgi:DNA-binding CsgD family transcriptional regulator
VLDQDFDAIVGDFYRAATGTLTWDSALDRVQVAFKARAVLIHEADMRTGQLMALHTGGPARNDASLDYVRDYHRIDPRRERIISMLPALFDKWWHCDEHFDDAFTERSPFFTEFMEAYDARFMSTLIVTAREDTFAAFALELPASRGKLTRDEREVVRRLGNHLHDALRAHQRTLALMSQALVGHKLIDAFPYPMWLLGQSRQVAFANPSALAEEASALRLARDGTVLRLVNTRSEKRLCEQLHLMCRQPHGSAAVLDLRRSTTEPPTWLHLSVLQAADVMGAFGAHPQILATLFDPRHVNALDTFALGSLFGLTPAEARIAGGLSEGRTAAELAARHGVAVPTVRRQIAEVITKLGADRAVDVVRMLRQGEALWSTADKSARLRA